MTHTIDSAAETSAWWRAALGEYPTGVCLVTGVAADRSPVGMVVGSFVAVSEDPPLVGFFAGRRSSTLPVLKESGRFTVSVLADRSESLCRAFATKDPGRWEQGAFESSGTGAPRVSDAVAWFDAEIEDVREYGDHSFLVGRITDAGAGSGAADMPLLFRRAGYGTFAAPSDTFDTRAFIERLRWATVGEREIRELADDFGVHVTVTSQIGDAVVTLAAVDPSSSASSYENVGASHPWAAPIASIFAAWAPPHRRRAWEEASRHLTGAVDRPLLQRILSGVRERGYAVAGDATLTADFLRLARSAGVERETYARIWADIATSRAELEPDGSVDWSRVAVVQMPVFSPDGEVAMALYAITSASFDRATGERLVERMSQTATRIARSIPLAPRSEHPVAAAGLWGDSWELDGS
ncbi:flavin reductase [Microbacterium kunmingense]|uniref:flavin reductase n=1 Tax=Microbacterium kunmingense TaxID=2915939 RepID=UPI0020067CCA|nr:flavin reductase [Microbacterium kunmingense]